QCRLTVAKHPKYSSSLSFFANTACCDSSVAHALAYFRARNRPTHGFTSVYTMLLAYKREWRRRAIDSMTDKTDMTLKGVARHLPIGKAPQNLEE
ncbi:MAG: hypothetical protein ABJ143_15465, partial [Parasphingorhabdus sp.]|uniref:hypothetical protein n=1 Tax=Parasphingorhabdus sp. TaxID=2709688 RepID=UPI003297972B